MIQSILKPARTQSAPRRLLFEVLESRDLLSLAPQSIPADVNHDGTVNIFDINAVSANWGGPGPAGDANGDGKVNVFDVNAISANWSPTLSPEIEPHITLRLDASDERNTTRTGAAQFNAASSQFLSTPDAPALDFASQMTVSFWVNQTAHKLDQNLISKWTYPTDGSWTISTGLHTGQEDELAVWFATPSGGFASVGITTSANLIVGRWYQVGVVYDGNQVGNANRLKIYIDGVQQALVFEAGSVPAVLPNSAAPLNVGKWGGTLDRYADAGMASLALWSTALSASSIQSLFNQGNGKEYGDLNVAEKSGLVAWWGLEESTGAARLNAHGAGLSLTDTTNVAQRQVLSAWHDIGAGLNLVQTYDRRPDYVENAINGRGAVRFDGINDILRTAVGEFPNDTSGSVTFVVRFPEGIDTVGSPTFFSSADESNQSRYFFFSAYPAGNADPETPRTFRIRWRLDGMNNDFRGNTEIELGSTYVVQVWNTAPAEPYHMRVNGVDQVLTGNINVWTGLWYGDIPGRDNVTTGAFQRAGGDIEGLANVLLGEVVVVNNSDSEAENRQVEQYLAEKWGVVLPAGGAATVVESSLTETAANHVESGDAPLVEVGTGQSLPAPAVQVSFSTGADSRTIKERMAAAGHIQETDDILASSTSLSAEPRRTSGSLLAAAASVQPRSASQSRPTIDRALVDRILTDGVLADEVLADRDEPWTSLRHGGWKFARWTESLSRPTTTSGLSTMLHAFSENERLHGGDAI